MNNLRRTTQLFMLLAGLPVVVYAVFASASWMEPIRYPDTAVFLKCGSAEGFQQLLVCGRPITAALMYRAFGNDPDAIILFQTVVALAAWIFTAASVSFFAQRLITRIVAFNAVMAVYVLFGFHTLNSALMADSLGASLTVVLIGFAALYVRTGRYLWMLILVFIAWANVRDTNAWAALSIAETCVAVSLVYKSSRQRYAAIALAAALSAIPFFVIDAATASLGVHQRWVSPFFNNIGQRILTDPEATRFFEDRGMPVSEALRSRAGTWGSSDDWHFLKIARA